MSFTNKGRKLSNKVTILEGKIFLFPDQKDANRELSSIESQLKSIKSDFESQAKILLEKIPSNRRSEQNIVNPRNKKVKQITVAEMNAALNQMKRLRTGSAGSSVSPTNLSRELREFSQKVTNLYSKEFGS